MRSKWILPLLACAAITASMVPLATAASGATTTTTTKPATTTTTKAPVTTTTAKPKVVTTTTTTTTTVPQISISNSSALEGNSGTRSMNFEVTLSAPAKKQATVSYCTGLNWNTAGGNATAGDLDTPGADFVAVCSGLTFNVGTFQQTITIPIIGDTVVEGDEGFTVGLFDPTNLTLSDPYGTGTIIDDDSPSGFQIGIGDASMRAQVSGNRTVQISVGFSDPAPKAFSITATTQDGTATGGTATTPGADYVSKTVTVGVAKNNTEKIVTLTILPNKVPEDTESFTVNLTSTYGTIVRPVGTVMIRDFSGTVNRPGRLPGAPRVALYGDSITAAYTNTVKPLLEAKGYAVMENSFPGTSILDQGSCAGEPFTNIVNQQDPDIFVTENLTNYSNPCDTSIAYGSPEYFSEWQSVAQLDTNIMLSQGAQVFWMIDLQAGPNPPDAVITQLNSIITNMVAGTPGTQSIDAFTPFGGDSPDWSLRSADHVHLSLTGEQLMSSLVNQAVTGSS